MKPSRRIPVKLEVQNLLPNRQGQEVVRGLVRKKTNQLIDILKKKRSKSSNRARLDRCRGKVKVWEMAQTEEIPRGFKKCKGKPIPAYSKGKGDLRKCDNQFEDYPHGILPATPEFFYRNKAMGDGLARECKLCLKKYHKEQYEAYHDDQGWDREDFVPIKYYPD